MDVDSVMPMDTDDPKYDQYRWTRAFRVHRRHYEKHVKAIKLLQKKAQRSKTRMKEYEDRLTDIGVNTQDL